MSTSHQRSTEPIDWKTVLPQHEGWLRSVVGNRLGNFSQSAKNEVDEVMQEIALAAVQVDPGSIDPEKVGAWLYQVAIRKTLMYRRSAGRRRKLLESAKQNTTHEPSETTSAKEDPLIWLMAAERAEQIRSAIDQLHRRDREILLLKYDHRWNYKQIMDHLGISQSAVEARLFRARNRLRANLVQRQLIEEKS